MTHGEYEIEFKFQVENPDKLAFLKEFEFQGEKHVIDRYLDIPTGELFKRGIFVRIRNNKTLDFKFNPEQMTAKTGEGVHEHCLEYNFAVPLQTSQLEKLNEMLETLNLTPINKADLNEFKKQNHLVEEPIFDKTRKTFVHNDFVYSLDELKNFGTFLEIEANTTDRKKVDEYTEQIRALGKKLGFKLITTGYNELYWRQHRFDWYLQGKYLLEEDQKFYGKNGLIPKTVAMLQEKFSSEHTGHDWEHIRRTWQNARTIAIAEKANSPIVELGALLHDFADWKEHNGNRTIGEEKTREWLEKNHADPETIQAVVQAIQNVSYKGPQSHATPTTLEGKIVQDADRLDALGAIGIIRAIEYGTAKKRSLYNPQIQPDLNQSTETFTQRTLQVENDSTINHFYEKLLLIKDRMHTPAAKKIAQKRHAYMEHFLTEFFMEWDGKDTKNV